MNDLWLFLGIFAFIFVLWIYSGGPNNPISFSGPYITPVTAPGVEQIGYGPSANTYYRTARTSGTKTDVTDTARSPYAGQVRIDSSDPRETDPRAEYIRLHATDANIPVSGWQLVSARSGTQVRIPDGNQEESKRPVRLSQDNDALIITGSRASDSLKSTYTYASAWHIFLGSRDEIWPSSDLITLLDQNGRVVDQYSY